MIFPIFNLALLPFYPALGLYTLHRRFIQKKSAPSFEGQWGKITPEMREFSQFDGPKIWLHAVSVGETMAAKPIAAAIKSCNPNAKIALSSTTDTGHEIAEAMLRRGEVDCVFYFPLDLPPVVSRVLSGLKPDKLCFIETELWPNLLHIANKRGIPTYLLNGRVSDNLLSTAPKIGPLWRWMSGNVSQFLMRNPNDAERLLSLGVDKNKVIITGDVKLEAPPISSETLRNQWRETLGIGDEKLLICGSTHAGEEEYFLEAAKAHPDLKIAIAPRHPNRFDEIAELVEKSGLKLCRRSSHKKWAHGEIFLLDTVGELSTFYAAGDIAFVGGSLIQRGGHNMLEPILHGLPVLFGPHVMNFRAAAQLILENELGGQVSKPDTYQQEIISWIDSALTIDKQQFKIKVEAVLQPHRGAAKRMAELVLS
jgi:3-deoxy-D-manno-octulosonic-acid transferase